MEIVNLRTLLMHSVLDGTPGLGYLRHAIIVFSILVPVSISAANVTATSQTDSIREKVEKSIRRNITEERTVLKNDKYEVEIIESIAKDAIWESGPIQATVWDSTYGYKYTVALDGTKINKVKLSGNYLYGAASFLGSTYASDSLSVVDLHSWKTVCLIEDLEDYEFSPDEKWFIYRPSIPKHTVSLGDEVDLAFLGEGAFSIQNLTGHEHKIVGDMSSRDENGVLKPVHWSAAKDRSRTWNVLSNFIWDRDSSCVYFLAGEKGTPNEDLKMSFSKRVLVKVDMPLVKDNGEYLIARDHGVLEFSVKTIVGPVGRFTKISWADSNSININSEDQPGYRIATSKWEKEWREPSERLRQQEN